MRLMTSRECLTVGLFACLIAAGIADQKALPPKYDERDLKNRYETFLRELDYVTVASDHPKVIKTAVGTGD